MNQYFGKPWRVPAVENGEQAETPVGKPCILCTERIQDGDRGWIFWITEPSPGPPRSYAQHAECQLLSMLGHDHGICSCTGYDVTQRHTARLLWQQLNMDATL